MHSRMGRVCAATARNRNGVFGVVGTIITLSTILIGALPVPAVLAESATSVGAVHTQATPGGRLPIQEIENLIKRGEFPKADSAISVWEQSPVHSSIASNLRKQLENAKMAARMIEEAEGRASMSARERDARLTQIDEGTNNLLAQGIAALKRGDYASSETSFQQVLSIDPTNVQARRGLEEARSAAGGTR